MNVFKEFIDNISGEVNEIQNNIAEEVNEMEDNINNLIVQEPEGPEETSMTLPPLEATMVDEDTGELIPEITPTPSPPPKSSLSPINIEGFGDVSLSTVEKMNNKLKQKFIDNFKF